MRNIIFEPSEWTCFAENAFGTETMSVEQTPASSVVYFCINPLVPRSRRCDANVVQLRNLLFECDTAPLEVQLQVLRDCGLPWASITYSGKKSYHAILSLEEPVPTKEDYKALHKTIREVLNRNLHGGTIDASNANPSRFSRYPGNFRPDTSQLQAPLPSAARRCTKRELLQWLTEHQATVPSIPTSMPKEEKATSAIVLLHWREFANRTTLRFLRDGAPLGDRHRLLYSAAANLRALGLPFTKIVEILQKAVFSKLQLSHNEFIRCIANAVEATTPGTEGSDHPCVLMIAKWSKHEQE
jgi:hypothetical protein